MVNAYRTFGNCFLFDFEGEVPFPEVDVARIMNEKRMKGFWIESPVESIDGETKYIYRVLVFDTYQPKARDLYYMLNGKHFQRLDTWTLACMCNFLGVKLKENVTLYDLSRMYDNYDLMA